MGRTHLIKTRDVGAANAILPPANPPQPLPFRCLSAAFPLPFRCISPGSPPPSHRVSPRRRRLSACASTPQHGLSSNKMAASIVLYYTPFRGLSSDTMALITPECGTMRSPSTKWRESPRIVAQCAPRAPNGPHHLGLCAPCRGQPDERLVPVDDGPSQPPARVLPVLPPSPLHPY